MRSKAARTQGLTLIETLVALLVLGIALAALISALLANTSLNTQVDRRNEAVRISEDVLEGYRQVGNYGGLQSTPPTTETVTRRNQLYSVTTTFCPADKPSTMPCSSTAVYIRVEVNNDNKLLHRAETYYTTFGQE